MRTRWMNDVMIKQAREVGWEDEKILQFLKGAHGEGKLTARHLNSVINHKTKIGETYFIISLCLNKCYKSVEYLLQNTKGLDLNVIDFSGGSAWDYATKSQVKDYEVINLLIKQESLDFDGSLYKIVDFKLLCYLIATRPPQFMRDMSHIPEARVTISKVREIIEASDKSDNEYRKLAMAYLLNPLDVRRAIRKIEGYDHKDAAHVFALLKLINIGYLNVFSV